MINYEEAMYYNEHRMKDSDSFNFECKGCGSCCNRSVIRDIPLNGVDIYHIAKGLALKDTLPVLVKYCQDPYPGNDSKVPVRLLEFDDGTGNCKLLTKNGKCSVHTEKPTICALFPLGRMYVADKSSKEAEIVYFAPPQSEDLPCSNSLKSQTLRQWKDTFSIETRDEEMEAWSTLAQKISFLVREYDPYSSDSSNMAFILFDSMLYVFDTAEGIVPQIEKRLKQLPEVEDALRELRELKLK